MTPDEVAMIGRLPRYVDLTDRLLWWQRERKVRANVIAQAAGVSTTTTSRWRQRRRRVERFRLPLIADALGISLRELVDNPEPRWATKLKARQDLENYWQERAA